MKKIALLIPYFGKMTAMFPLVFETIKRNNTIDFIFYTDLDLTDFEANNVRCVKSSFSEYVKGVNNKMSLDFKPVDPYKICDLRPLFGRLHEEDFRDYDFYGWTDIDILFGDIRSFYTDEILEKYDVLSTHKIRISGHFALFKNNSANKDYYKRIYDWKNALKKKEFVGIDEHGLTNAYNMTLFDKLNEKFKIRIENPLSGYLKKKKSSRLYLKEQYTTPFTTIPWIDGTVNSNQPDYWEYTDGTIRNSRDQGRNFMYLHLMNFNSSRWRHDGTKAPWEGKLNFITAKPEDMESGITIDRTGIHPKGV